MVWDEDLLEYCIRQIHTNKVTLRELSKELGKSQQCIRAKLRRHNYPTSNKQAYRKTINCLKCKQELKIRRTSKQRFCSSSCSASYNNTGRVPKVETKRKTSSSLRKYNTDHTQDFHQNRYHESPRHCKVCSATLPYLRRYRKTCSNECFIKHASVCGRLSAVRQSRERRSRNEILFAQKCKEHFSKVLTNQPLFNGWDADVIIQDIKVAVLWNGKWHYEKITTKHSVSQVQNRDRIKLEEIERSGYIPYVIKDTGSYSSKKVLQEFALFVEWCSSLQLTKL